MEGNRALDCREEGGKPGRRALETPSSDACTRSDPPHGQVWLTPPRNRTGKYGNYLACTPSTRAEESTDDAGKREDILSSSDERRITLPPSLTEC